VDVVGARRLALLCFVVLALPASGETLRILYTNDLHARLDRLASIERIVGDARGGPEPVLVLDAGDAWQDFRIPVYSVWGAERVVAWMNRVGYAAMAPGNHDFYLGASRFEAQREAAAFPLVCANLRAIDGSPLPFPPSIRTTAGGLDVLVVGLTALEHIPYLDFPWLRPRDPVGALRDEIERAPGQPDLIVCLAHVSLHDAERLARALPAIDLFITGHTHAVTREPRRVGNTVVVQSGGFGHYVGDLVLDVADGEARIVRHALVPTEREAATDLGHGLARLFWIGLTVLAFGLLLVL
jgi:5'-nucleotidase